MKNLLKFLFFCLFLISCKKNNEVNQTRPKVFETPKLTLNQAKKLIQLPIHCINKEYPNKLNQTIGDISDLKSPKELHPAFFGCFDWHSSVHGHWSLVALLKQFPSIEGADEIKKMLIDNISEDNIKKEVEYFKGKYNSSFERTYGWAWLLKLAEEVHTWNSNTAKVLEKNLHPLTELIVQKYLEFLPKLNYPIRVGEHPNTAFGMSFAWDYAKTVGNEGLKKVIKKRARDFYLTDGNCPIAWEPSGFDFLSSCLEEAAIMKRIMSAAEFRLWLGDFLPQIKNKDFKLSVGEVSDRTDGKLVHLDGLNFSRAWNLYTIVKGMPKYQHLKNIANEHIAYSLPNLIEDSYEGGHWLGSFAIYALKQADND